MSISIFEIKDREVIALRKQLATRLLDCECVQKHFNYKRMFISMWMSNKWFKTTSEVIYSVESFKYNQQPLHMSHLFPWLYFSQKYSL